MGSSPILNVYLWYERPFADDQICCLRDTTYEWIFHRSNFMNPGEHNQYCVCLVVSAARRLINVSRRQLVQAAIEDVQRVYPQTRTTQPTSSSLFWERNATFSCTPENVEKRPDHGTSLSNLFLAGDWTNTGLPATIEGATLSGHRCAGMVLGG